MNYGPLEFGAFLRRKARKDDSAEVRAARDAAPGPPPEENQLTVVSGPAAPVPLAGADDAVGVYEAIASPAAEAAPGPIRVLVQPASRPVVLVLSSHRPVHWRIEMQPDAQLQAVLLAGCGEARVSGIAAERVVSIGGSYAFGRSAPAFQHLAREVLRHTGCDIEHFQSLYAGEVSEVGGPQEMGAAPVS